MGAYARSNEQETGGTVSVDIVVRFAETDAMGVVHHANYVTWFELGRIAWMDAVGMPYAEVAAGGNHFAVTSVNIEYRQSARFGDTVTLAAGIDELRSRKVSFVYEIRDRASTVLLALGRTEHICVDLEGRMAKIPTEVLVRFQNGMAARLAENATP